MTDLRISPVYDAKPGAVKRTFWMGYAVTPHKLGIKIEGCAPMTMADARAFMHSVVDQGADDLIRRFNY